MTALPWRRIVAFWLFCILAGEAAAVAVVAWLP